MAALAGMSSDAMVAEATAAAAAAAGDGADDRRRRDFKRFMKADVSCYIVMYSYVERLVAQFARKKKNREYLLFFCT